MTSHAAFRNERGIALVVVLLVVLAIAAIAAGAALLGSSTSLISVFHSRMSVMEESADAGLEEARSMVNAAPKTNYPDTGYKILENGVAVYNAAGAVIPNIKRWTYVGPIGISSGQFGVFGSAVSVVQNAQGDRVIRRGEIFQESFAKYAYFTNVEGSIQFGSGDQIKGPVFSNDNISIAAAGATFWGPVATHGTINGQKTAPTLFKMGYTEHAPTIAFPQTADLNKLLAQATTGNTAIVGTTQGTAGQATTRIEFVAVDLNNDGVLNGIDEGFMRVYQVKKTTPSLGAYGAWVVADTGGYGTNGVATPYGGANVGLKMSRNCGHIVTSGPAPQQHAYFKTFRHHKQGNTSAQDSVTWALTNGTNLRCYLGGSEMLNDSIPASALHNRFLTGVTSTTGACTPANSCDSIGNWLPWPGSVAASVIAKRNCGTPATCPGDANFLWPINRTLNPNFKGVIFVTGKVAISGVLRGQITLAATDNIVIADDVTYATNPGLAIACNSVNRDMLGLFSGTDIVVADNLIDNPYPAISGGAAKTWDDNPEETIHGVVLALSNFTVENYDQPPSTGETCGTTPKGRGCLALTGGVIQLQRGAVGTGGGTGNLKQYSYDACAATNPPPYFPTTGHFASGHYYEIEPTGFNIATYWPLLTPSP